MVMRHPTNNIITGLVGCDDFIQLYVAVNFLFLVIFVFPLFQNHYYTQKQWKNTYKLR